MTIITGVVSGPITTLSAPLAPELIDIGFSTIVVVHPSDLIAGALSYTLQIAVHNTNIYTNVAEGILGGDPPTEITGLLNSTSYDVRYMALFSGAGTSTGVVSR